MRIAVLVFALAFTSGLRADFGYENRTEITGGELLRAALDDGTRARQPPAMHYIKGSRLATVTKDHATVLNLDNDTVLEIDFSKKTYFWTTFAKIKPEIAAASFDVSEKLGGSKDIGILTAREHLIAMNGPPNLARIFVDYWTITPPGGSEMQDFHRRLAAKLGYAYALGLADVARFKPELLPGFEEAAKMLIQSAEMPAEITIRLGTAELAPASEKPQAKSGIVGRIGNIAHRRGAPHDGEPGLLAEVTVDLGSFSAGPADEAKFNVPAGFREIKK